MHAGAKRVTTANVAAMTIFLIEFPLLRDPVSTNLDVDTAVLRPRRLLASNGIELPAGRRRHLCVGYPEREKERPCALGPRRAEPHVVFVLAARVAVPGQEHPSGLER